MTASCAALGDDAPELDSSVITMPSVRATIMDIPAQNGDLSIVGIVPAYRGIAQRVGRIVQFATKPIVHRTR